MSPFGGGPQGEVLMPRKSSRTRRPSEIVMEELSEEQIPWNLEEHLNGCLAGYQAAPIYGAAVFFALEALWGIARDVGVRTNAGKFDPDQLDKDWLIAPTTRLDVPWIWIRSLATAWGRRNTRYFPSIIASSRAFWPPSRAMSPDEPSSRIRAN